MVYAQGMSGADANSDDEARAEALKRETADLQELEAKTLSVEEARRLRGSGWDGDFEELRCGRSMQP